MKLYKYFLPVLGLFWGSEPVYAGGHVFDIIPLWGITVDADVLGYSNITVKTADGSGIVNNNIPQNLEFSVVIQKPEGFVDSAGWLSYGLELVIMKDDGSGKIISTIKDMMGGTGVAQKYELSEISYSLTFDAQTKPNSKIKLKARVYDKRGRGYISYIYFIKIVSASKRLPGNVLSYEQKDSRGMKSSSVGLHFNFFEFKGIEGNKFLYKIHKSDPIEFTLKGLLGWKIKEGKAAPRAELELMDADGNTVETEKNVLAKTLGLTMPSDKKELPVTYKPKAPLESGKFYFVWVKVRDENSPKNALDVVVKVYVE